MPDPKEPSLPQPIAWPDAKTVPVAVPFELLEQCHVDEAPPQSSSSSEPASPFDELPNLDLAAAPSPSRSFGVESTGKYSLEDFLSATGDVLLLGDPFDVASTTVVSSTVPSGDGSDETVTTSILVGRDIERMLSPATVLAPNPARPTVELSSFEQFVNTQLDGKRPIEAVAIATGLSIGDLRIALALLADKDQLVVVSTTTTPTPPTPRAPSSTWNVPSIAPSHAVSASRTFVSRSFAPITVLRRIDGVAGDGLSALESFVLLRVDGQRSVAALREDMKLSESDLALALELLQRRGLVERATALPRSTPAAAPKPPSTPPTQAPATPPTTTPTTTAPTTTAPTTAAATLQALLLEAERKEAQGDLAGAAAALQKAVRLNTKDAAMWNRLGTTLVRLYDLPGALAALNAALALSPNDPTIVSNQSRVALLATQVVRSPRR